jgi:hypothetical protein
VRGDSEEQAVSNEMGVCAERWEPGEAIDGAGVADSHDMVARDMFVVKEFY